MLKKAISLFLAMAISLMGLGVTAIAAGDTDVVSVSANKVSETPDKMSYKFCIDESGWYNLSLISAFYLTLGDDGAEVSVSVDGGKSVQLSENTLKQIDDTEYENSMKNYEMLDGFELSKGVHKIQFTTKKYKSDSYAKFQLESFTFTKSDKKVVIITNEANAAAHEGLKFDSAINSTTPGYATYKFDIPESGYYKLDMFTRFWITAGKTGANVKISIDNGNSIEWQPYTLIDLDGADTDSKRHYEVRDGFYLTKGEHEIKVTSEYYKSTETAQLLLDNFTFTKTDSVFVSAWAYHGNSSWTMTEDNGADWQLTYDHAVTNNLGTASYEVYVPEDGAYSITLDMDCSINNTSAGAKVLLGVDGVEKGELSTSNTVSLGGRANNIYANTLQGYKYTSPLNLTKGNHTITITTAKANNTWFNYGGFALTREDFVTVKATKDNIVSAEGIVVGVTGRVESGRAGNVTFNFDIPSDGYYNLDMYTAFWWQVGDAGAAVSMSIDNGALIEWSQDTLMQMNDSGKDGMRTHKVLDSFWFTKGTHTIKFVTEYRNNPEWAVFHLEKFTFTKTDKITVAATGIHGEITGWSSNGFNQISTGELGSGDYTVYIPETALYLPTFYMGCTLNNENAGSNVYMQVDGGATLALDASNTKYICDAPGDSLKIYAVKNPIRLTKGEHIIKISTETGIKNWSTYFWFGKMILEKTESDFGVAVAEDTLHNGDMTTIEAGYMFGTEAGMPYGAYATYASANTDIADVDEEGNIYAYEPGRTVINIQVHDGDSTKGYTGNVYVLADNENLIVEDAKAENGKIEVTVGARGGDQQKAFDVYAAVYNGKQLVGAYKASPSGMAEGSSETFTFDCGELGTNTVKLFTWGNYSPIYSVETVK